MRLYLFLCILLYINLIACSKEDQPDTNDSNFWIIENPENNGYSLTKLQEAKDWADANTQTEAVMVIVNNKLIYQWGDMQNKILTHSTRKSFMSALYGIYVNNGTINLDATMAELGIDDIPPLSEQEKTATIRHCLQACSGVFHTAEAESDGMHNLKPDRDSYLPGTFWIYNNWDFNVLRTIFEQVTGKNFFVALYEDILAPIGVEDFELSTDSMYYTPTRSIHPAYMFQISARDMARFGLLIQNDGVWEGKQIVPRDWVAKSTKYCWDAAIYHGDGYGYMWWVATNENEYSYLPNCNVPKGTFSARGAGGQWIEIIPEYNMVFIHRVDTWQNNNVTSSDIGTILQKILDAKL